MSSCFRYYRPRGIMGNYIVEIILDLSETETGEVWVARNRDHNCGYCGKQMPQTVEAHPKNGTRQLAQYIIGDFVVDDVITIKIKDELVVPIQETSHTATMEGFYHKLEPFWLNRTKWEDVCLNPIHLIDKDSSDRWFDKVPREPRPKLPQPARVRQVQQKASQPQPYQLAQGYNSYPQDLMQFFISQGVPVNVQAPDGTWHRVN